MQTKRYRYQIPFACFECHKAYKRPYIVKEQQRSAWLSQRISGKQPSKPFAMPTYRCPGCDGLLTMMGRAFRAPRSDDIDQWQKAELMARSGFTSHSSGGHLPKTLNEARKFVEANRKISKGEKLAKRIRSQAALCTP
jgi:hypothetical protein